MKKIEKKTSTSEHLYITDDGMEFQYESLARDHELDVQKKLIEKVKRISPKPSVIFPHIKIEFFYPESKTDLVNVIKYVKMQGCSIAEESVNSIAEPKWIGTIKSGDLFAAGTAANIEDFLVDEIYSLFKVVDSEDELGG